MLVQKSTAHQIDLLNKPPLNLPTRYLTHQAFAAYLLMDDRKQSSIYRHIKNLQRILDHAPNLTEIEIDEYFIQLKEQGLKNTYLNSLICTIRQYAKFKQIPELQHFRFRKKEIFQKATLSDEEIQAFLELPPKKVRRIHSITGKEYFCPANPKLYDTWTTFFSIMAFTGMRPGEVTHLKVGDVDWGRGVFVIRDSKTNQPGISPIPPNIKERIERHIKSLPINQEYLFLSTYGRQTKRWNGEPKVFCNVDWHYNFHTRIKRLEIRRPNLTPYSLRHSFATRLLESDVSLFHVKKLMRHNDLKSTLVYEHLTTKDLIRAVKKLPMVRFGSDPKLIFQDVVETIKAFELEDDPRFTFSIQESNESVEIKIKLKV